MKVHKEGVRIRTVGSLSGSTMDENADVRWEGGFKASVEVDETFKWSQIQETSQVASVMRFGGA